MSVTVQSPEWGVRPVLMTVAGWPVPAYSVFMLLAVAVGLVLFRREVRLQQTPGDGMLAVVLAALFGGVIGAKLPFVVVHAREIAAAFPDLTALLSGRSIIGGLIGGATGVFVAKRAIGLKERRGNLFVPGILAGVAVGRLGCFLRGCCHGTPTGLPWGVDFGDGVPRHPTQLYEAVFAVALLPVAFIAVRRWPQPAGAVFKGFMVAYFSFRFVIEFIRTQDPVALGLTVFQWVALGAAAFYAVDLVRLLRTEGRQVSP